MKNKECTTIGPRTQVSFPDYAIQDVPAKVDTGADSSSLWATDITEKNGVLSFVLFGPTSPWYTGKIIKTDKFTIRSIKNSFGTSEFRYKISLKVEIGGRIIRARFTLSNRSNNRYPILIGRQTLKNKFIVDVSKVYEDIPLEILVLVHNGNESITKSFEDLAQDNSKKLTISIVRYDQLQVSADSTNSSIVVRDVQRDLASYDYIYFLTRVRDATLASMVAAYAKRHGINFSDKVSLQQATDTKAHQSLLLSGRSIRIPKTIYINRNHWLTAFDELERELGLPFIFKDDAGRKGRHNYLISDKASFNKVAQKTINEGIQMIAQKYIPNNGYYRIVVMGRCIQMVVYRNIDSKRSHLYKKSIDGPAELIDITSLPAETRQMAISAADMLQIDIAGVDFIQDNKTQLWYCLEVNNSPQLVGGTFVKRKMQSLGDFFIREAGK